MHKLKCTNSKLKCTTCATKGQKRYYIKTKEKGERFGGANPQF